MMEIKDILNEYYTETEETFEPPYDPKEELEKIKRRAALRKTNERRRIYISTLSAAAVLILVCAAVYGNARLKPDTAAGGEVTDNAERLAKADEQRNEEQPTPAAKPEENTPVYTAAPTAANAMRAGAAPRSEEPMYTYVPQITPPPYRVAEVTDIVPELPDFNLQIEEPPLSYRLDGREELQIEENEDVPSGAAMHASDGSEAVGEGEMWSEERYFEYLGINPLIGFRLPDDMVKSAAEEGFVMMNLDGTIYNDRRTFTYANSDRTRLASVTTSREELSQQEITTEINGVKAVIYDNHMSATAILKSDKVNVMIETYGLSGEEIKEAVYSCAEVIR